MTERQRLRSQPRPRARPRHRVGGAGRRPLDGPGRQERAPTAPPSRPCAIVLAHRARWTASSSSARARRTRRPCSTTASGSATARPPLTDIAVDPIDGTTLTALGPGQRPRGHRRQRAGHDVRPGPVRLHGEDRRRPRGAPASIDITAQPSPRTCARWPRPSGERVRDLTAVILDRDRHDELIAEVRAAGARIRLIPDGDVAGAIATAWPDAGADILFGIGGTPEGVIAAAALKCMGGEMQGRLWPRNDERAQRPPSPPATTSTGCSTTDDLVAGRQLLLRRHRHHRRRAARGRALTTAAAPRTQSLVMRSAVGHGAPDQRPPPARQAPGLRRRSTTPERRGRGAAALAVLKAS